MKYMIIVLVIAGVVGYFATSRAHITPQKPDSNRLISKLNASIAPSPVEQNTRDVLAKTSQTSLFVPYWTLSSQDIDTANFSYVIYFGVGADTKGIDPTSVDTTAIQKFIMHVPAHTQTFLAVRMTDTDSNSEVLKKGDVQQKIADQAVQLAQQNNFNGVLLDFEMSAISFDTVTNRVSNFYKLFASTVHANNLKFYVTLYGDTYYRVRPYNVKDIASRSDQVLIMAYDFHKARGNPGPNFPLAGKEIYGYDFKQMLSDFKHDVPVNKLTVVYGLYGYDWTVDKDGNSIGQTEPKSFAEIQKNYLSNCNEQNCRIFNPDAKASERKVTYTDEQGKHHEMWFEDQNSMKAKQAYAKSIGVVSSSLWAYTYY